MMGTGRFALPTFLSLYDTPHSVVGLFTQPDRTGRGHHRHVNPLKEAALERGTPVFQPQSINTPESVGDLRSLEADLCIVAAYGQILKPDVIGAASLGAVNVHASLLPKYRGAAPIQYAIWHGETETGVTLFQIEPRLDAGPILAMDRLPIGPRDTSGDLEPRLAEFAVPLVRQVLDGLVTGDLPRTAQDPAHVTLAPRLKKSDGGIDWSQSAHQISCHIRAMQPWPTPFTFYHGEGRKPLRLIVTTAAVLPSNDEDIVAGRVGTVAAVRGSGLVINTGDGFLEIHRVRPEGKREMPIADFVNGHHIAIGDQFGPE